MEFGLALDLGTTSGNLRDHLRSQVELVRLAEEKGFGSIWAGETYPAQIANSHLPSPLIGLAWLAPHTRLTLGTAVTLLPAWNPLKLAYDVAVLDQLTEGRLILGVGLGSPELWKRFGTPAEGIGDYVDDMLRALRALWGGGRGYEGRHVQVQGSIAPRPVRGADVPIWVGGSIRRSVRRAAELGDAYYVSSSYPLPHIHRQVQRYGEELGRAGKNSESPVVSANRFTVVAETASAAREIAVRYVGEGLVPYARRGSFGEEARALADDVEALFDRVVDDVCLVGTPDEVVARLEHYRSAGVTHVQCRVTPAGLPAEAAARTIELMATRVMPSFV